MLICGFAIHSIYSCRPELLQCKYYDSTRQPLYGMSRGTYLRCNVSTVYKYALVGFILPCLETNETSATEIYTLIY